MQKRRESRAEGEHTSPTGVILRISPPQDEEGISVSRAKKAEVGLLTGWKSLLFGLAEELRERRQKL